MYCINEAYKVFANKFPKLLDEFEQFFAAELKMSRIVKTPEIPYEVEKSLRDKKDAPVIRSAIYYEADFLLTGDKDLIDLKIDRPLIVTPRQFLDNY